MENAITAAPEVKKIENTNGWKEKEARGELFCMQMRHLSSSKWIKSKLCFCLKGQKILQISRHSQQQNITSESETLCIFLQNTRGNKLHAPVCQRAPTFYHIQSLLVCDGCWGHGAKRRARADETDGWGPDVSDGWLEGWLQEMADISHLMLMWRFGSVIWFHPSYPSSPTIILFVQILIVSSNNCEVLWKELVANFKVLKCKQPSFFFPYTF